MEDGLRPLFGRIPSFLMIAFGVMSMQLIAQAPASNSVSMTCYGQINISLPTSGRYTVMPSDMVRNRPIDHLVVRVGDTGENLIDCRFVNQLVKVIVLDTLNHISCWGNILVEDKSPFSIQCRDTILTCSADLQSQSLTSLVTITDNCYDPNDYTITWMTAEDEKVKGSGDTTYILTRYWTVRHRPSGEIRRCQSTIYLVRFDLANIEFPPDITLLGCISNPLDTSITGSPRPSRVLLAAQCDIAYSTRILSEFPKSCTEIKYLREWTALDWNTNEERKDTQIIIRRDTTPFVINGQIPFSLDFNLVTCMQDIIIAQGTIIAGCSPVDSSYIRIRLDGLDRKAGDTIRGLSVGTHELIYSLNSLFCQHPSRTDTIIFEVGNSGLPPVLSPSHFWPVTVPIEQEIDVDSLFDKAGIASCNPFFLLARKVNGRCTFDVSTDFLAELRFCFNEQLCNDASAVDSVEIEVIAVDAITAQQSNVVRVWVFPQDKVVPELSLYSEITLDLGTDNILRIDTSVIVSLFGDNSGSIKSLMITGSGTTLSGSGSMIMSGSGSSLMTGSGFPILSSDFTCHDIGTYDITVTAMDCSGNMTTKITQLTVTDSANSCPPPAMMASYVGEFLTLNDQYVMGVELLLKSTSDARVATTGTSGMVIENELIPDSVDYTFSFDYLLGTNWKEHVTASDLSLLQGYLVGVHQFSDSIDYYAADINDDGVVSALDVIEMIRIITNQNTKVRQEVAPWFFILENLDGVYPLKDHYHNSILHGGMNPFVYRVAKKGDLDRDATLNLLQGQNRSFSSLIWQNDLIDNQTNELQLKLESNDLRAVQFALSIPADKIRAIHAPDYYYQIGANEVYFIGYDVKGRFGDIRIEIDASLSELTLSDELIAREFSKNGSASELQLREQLSSGLISENLIAFPNPFDESVTLDMTKSSFGSKEQLRIRVVDGFGRIIYSQLARMNDAKTIVISDLKHWYSGMYSVEVIGERSQIKTYILKI